MHDQAYDSYDAHAELRRSSQLDAALDELNKVHARLAETVDVLIQRLDPVTQPSVPQAKTESLDREAVPTDVRRTSPIVTRLTDMTTVVDRVRRQVTDVLDRLDV